MPLMERGSVTTVCYERRADGNQADRTASPTLGTASLRAPGALDPIAEEALLRKWEPLVLRIARYMALRFEGNVESEDLEQVARLALLQAARRFDPERNCRFSTFAYSTIMGHIRHYLRDRAPAVRIPRRWVDLRPRLKRAAEELAQALGREPSVGELADRLGVSEEEVTG